jgi:thiaminase
MTDDTTAFTTRAWSDIAGWRDAIRTMPFIESLTDGTLPQRAFAYYLEQDAAYLVEFSRALAIASSRAPDRDAQMFFALSAHTALSVEAQLHHEWLRTHDAYLRVNISPVTAAYTDHLLATAARDPYPVLVAALLPCYWLYAHIAEVIVAKSGDLANHPYGTWIGTYADPAFQQAAADACAIADRAAAGADAIVRGLMSSAFGRSAMHEYLFFDQALTQPQWPEPPAR